MTVYACKLPAGQRDFDNRASARREISSGSRRKMRDVEVTLTEVSDA